MGKPIGVKKMTRVLDRDHGFCVLKLDGCQIVASCADHRANRGAGGAKSLDEFSQLVAACGLCNGRKTHVSGDERDELIRRGLIVTPASTHEKTAQRARDTPVEYPNGERWWLTDDCTREPSP